MLEHSIRFLINFYFQSDVNLSFKTPSPLGQLQQLTISDNSMTSQMPTNIPMTSSGKTLMSKMSPASVISSSVPMLTTSNFEQTFMPKTGPCLPTHVPNQQNIFSQMPMTSQPSTNVSMTSLPSTTEIEDDVEMSRQKILADILSDDEKHIPENFDTILNPIYFDFSS